MKKFLSKILSILVVFTVAMCMLTPTGSAFAKTRQITLNKTKATITVGKWSKIKVRHTKSEITWSSSNKAVAKVTHNGWVHAIKRGKCWIYADVDGQQLRCRVKVTVPAPEEREINPEKKIVAFTFDDGPSKYTPQILKTLGAYGATATFFQVGYNVSNYKKYVQAVVDAGCEVGNHTLDHPNLNTLSAEKVRNQVEGNLNRINSILGEEKRLLRPPYGNYNDNVKALGYPIITWSDDSRDWESRNAQKVFEEIKHSARDGYIILMHDLYESTAEAVKLILPWLVSEGYQICSVSEMFEARGEKLEGGKVYSRCITAEQYKAKMQK